MKIQMNAAERRILDDAREHTFPGGFNVEVDDEDAAILELWLDYLHDGDVPPNSQALALKQRIDTAFA